MSTFIPINEHDTRCTCGAELYEHAGVACPPARSPRTLVDPDGERYEPELLQVVPPAGAEFTDAELAQVTGNHAAGELVAPGEFAVPESLAAEELSEALRQSDLLHPNGRCTCAGEGRCDWCVRVGNKLDEEGEG